MASTDKLDLRATDPSAVPTPENGASLFSASTLGDAPVLRDARARSDSGCSSLR
jgi:hypothetical protein